MHCVGLRSVGYPGYSPVDGSSVVSDTSGHEICWLQWSRWTCGKELVQVKYTVKPEVLQFVVLVGIAIMLLACAVVKIIIC